MNLSGYLFIGKNGHGWIVPPGSRLNDLQQMPFIPKHLIKQNHLEHGAFIEVISEENKIVSVESVGGLAVNEFAKRKRLKDLVALNPEQRFMLGESGEISMRVLDMFAPVGKGTRGLIVSPPRAGKTTLLENLAHGIHASDPEARLHILLVDERPEEVTHIRRSVPADVYASSNDESTASHIQVVEWVMNMAKLEAETGKDVVILLDSLTRLGRAYNKKGSGSGRVMSGGVEAGALDIPRRFFGLARNIENGGSLTILATILVDTGSRMDQLIFEEFKGTGNCEVVLNRKMADQRIFPAIDIKQSGTRRDEQLIDTQEYDLIQKLRRRLIGRDDMEAMQALVNTMKKYDSNRELLASLTNS